MSPSLPDAPGRLLCLGAGSPPQSIQSSLQRPRIPARTPWLLLGAGVRRPGRLSLRLGPLPVSPCRAVVEAVHRLDLILSNKAAYQEVFKPENVSLRNK